jgi:hypothetical protein
MMIILVLEESIVSITGVKRHFAVHGDIFILIHAHVFVIDQAMMLEEIVIPTSVATN